MIDAEGRFYVGSQEVLQRDAAALKEAIARVAGEDRSQPVIVRADARSQTQSVITAMEVLGQLGFSRVSLPVTPGTTP